MCEILDDAHLSKYKSKFAKIGLESTELLAEAEDEDLEEAGLSRFEMKRLKRTMDKKKDSEK